jgi:hypothetical protein
MVIAGITEIDIQSIPAQVDMANMTVTAHLKVL